jgi:hypothetical protein
LSPASTQDVVRNIESALRDNIHGPSPLVFDRAQAYVYALMRNVYFPKFQHSPQYKKVRSHLLPLLSLLQSFTKR